MREYKTIEKKRYGEGNKISESKRYYTSSPSNIDDKYSGLNIMNNKGQSIGYLEFDRSFDFKVNMKHAAMVDKDLNNLFGIIEKLEKQWDIIVNINSIED